MLGALTMPLPNDLAASPNQRAETRHWQLDYDVVARRINRAPSSLEQQLLKPDLLPVGRGLRLASGGTLRLDAPFERAIDGPEGGWRAHARLIGHGPRVVRYSRVDVVIAPWSDEVCELRVVPRSRRLHRWGTWRLRRYWRLAHDAADHLVPLLRSG